MVKLVHSGTHSAVRRLKRLATVKASSERRIMRLAPLGRELIVEAAVRIGRRRSWRRSRLSWRRNYEPYSVRRLVAAHGADAKPTDLLQAPVACPKGALGQH